MKGGISFPFFVLLVQFDADADKLIGFEILIYCSLVDPGNFGVITLRCIIEFVQYGSSGKFVSLVCASMVFIYPYDQSTSCCFDLGNL